MKTKLFAVMRLCFQFWQEVSNQSKLVGHRGMGEDWASVTLLMDAHDLDEVSVDCGIEVAQTTLMMIDLEMSKGAGSKWGKTLGKHAQLVIMRDAMFKTFEGKSLEGIVWKSEC